LFTPPSVPTPSGPPVIAQVIPDEGPHDQLVPVSILGSGFSIGGPPSVLFGPNPATSVNVVNDTRIDCIAPIGVDALTQNPLGPVAVTVTNSNGSDILPQGYTQTPSVKITPNPPQIGKPVEFLGDIGSPGFLESDGGAPISNVPIPPLAGNLTLLPQFSVVPFSFQPNGTASKVFLLSDPALLGVPLNIQGVVVTSVSPLIGGFTNTVTFQLQP
jgi:hypothetical protein